MCDVYDVCDVWCWCDGSVMVVVVPWVLVGANLPALLLIAVFFFTVEDVGLDVFPRQF